MLSGAAFPLVSLAVCGLLIDLRVRGTSGFAERFSAGEPRDRRGRSLYQLDLNRRLMKYPCSYLIYVEILRDTKKDLPQVPSERRPVSRSHSGYHIVCEPSGR